MNNRIILLLAAVLIGLSAHADYTVQTYQPLYSNPMASYSAAQPYAQQYNQGYYQNPYQAQYQGQYVNPYQYQSPYSSYGNNSPYGIMSNSNVPQQIVRSIGQSMLFSMLRGY